MDRKAFLQLIDWYGTDKANKARDWFISEHTTAFRACISDQARFCRNNEYLWA